MFHKLPSVGIDFLLKDDALLKKLSKKNVGLITNQSALTQTYIPSAYALQKTIDSALKCILTPEHGWSGLIREGVDIEDGFDLHLGLPILSLYGKNKSFLKFITENNIDTILIDLQDIGMRCYTYTTTCAKFLEACKNIPLEIFVCDRPNPLGPKQQGPALDPSYRSILGYLEVPFQHGQTIGQLLLAFNNTLKNKFSLTLLPCPTFHIPYHYPWVPPSPNLPSWDAVLLYPGLVLLEGVNISEGRGTTLPFMCLGAPELNNSLLVNFLNTLQPKSIAARPLTFTPQSGDFKGIECQGAHLLLKDPSELDALSLGIQIIYFLKENYPNFEWTKMTPLATFLKGKDAYFIDYLVGSPSFRETIDQGSLPSLDTRRRTLVQSIDEFKRRV